MLDEHEQGPFCPCSSCDCIDFEHDSEAELHKAGPKYPALFEIHNKCKELYAWEGSLEHHWPGACASISKALAELLGTPWIDVYGFYTGYVKPGTMFYNRPGFCRHSWCVNRKTGAICDPTRWVFEGVEPYLFLIEEASPYYADLINEYDEGMLRFKTAMLKPAPKSKGKKLDVVWHGSAGQVVKSLLKTRQPTHLAMNQLFWLANLPPIMFDTEARNVYITLIELKLQSLIPIDNRKMVLG
jgi:hypothetical protein